MAVLDGIEFTPKGDRKFFEVLLANYKRGNRFNLDEVLSISRKLEFYIRRREEGDQRDLIDLMEEQKQYTVNMNGLDYSGSRKPNNF